MTVPLPHDNAPDPDDSKKNWFNRYMNLEAKQDVEIRKILAQAAQDAQKQITALDKKKSFSAGVKSAQLKLVMDEIKDVLADGFKQLTPVLSNGQKQAASGVIRAFNATDRAYLEAAFKDVGGTKAISAFVSVQRKEAQSGIAALVSKTNDFGYPLSGRVYRTRSLATGWVQNTVARQLVLRSSAAQIANTVRSSILTNTPGGVGYAAMRLGRTELNNAFHAQAIQTGKDRPWVNGMVWHTSRSHKVVNGKVEVCETLNGRNFSNAQVPPKPHPQCYCYIVPDVESFDSFITHLTAGQYKGWIDNAA